MHKSALHPVYAFNGKQKCGYIWLGEKQHKVSKFISRKIQWARAFKHHKLKENTSSSTVSLIALTNISGCASVDEH